MTALDHVVLAGPDLAALVAAFVDATGVRPAPGGSHVGLGTRNELVDLGGGAYLELIGPDPDQPEPDVPRPFGIDALAAGDAPRIVTWAVRTDDLDATLRAARAAGHDPGPGSAMSRRTVDGELLRWRLTPALVDAATPVALVPFVIDWGTTAHPTSRALPVTRCSTGAPSTPTPAPCARHWPRSARSCPSTRVRRPCCG